MRRAVCQRQLSFLYTIVVLCSQLRNVRRWWPRARLPSIRPVSINYSGFSFYAPAPIAGVLSDDARLTFVCCVVGPKSRTERIRKTKINAEVAHITDDSDTTLRSKGQRSPCRSGGILWPGLPYSFSQNVIEEPYLSGTYSCNQFTGAISKL